MTFCLFTSSSPCAEAVVSFLPRASLNQSELFYNLANRHNSSEVHAKRVWHADYADVREHSKAGNLFSFSSRCIVLPYLLIWGHWATVEISSRQTAKLRTDARDSAAHKAKKTPEHLGTAASNHKTWGPLETRCSPLGPFSDGSSSSPCSALAPSARS